ncbi:unnamed protein product [Orchesella dallaii]|uniref:F-box domain-containing protein n=1 Tax=Orchesella dallaii TaxID=48710 RepID=A0ABP1QJL8_9HEXA
MESTSASNSCATDLDSNQQLDNKQNPMLNYVILKNVFDLVPFKLEEFKNFRLVSHVWNECAVPVVRKNAWLNLNANAETHFHNDGRVLRHIPLLDSISYCLQKSQELSLFLNGTLRFKKYLISKELLMIMPERHWINFWGKFGPLMTHLDISDAFIDAKDFREILFELTPNLKVLIFKRNYLSQTAISSIASNVLVWDERYRPQESSINKNLTHLTIMNVNIEYTGLPFSWIDIICHFPNLKYLKLSLWSIPDGLLALRSFEEFLQAVILVRQNCGQHHLVQLQHLDIMEIPENKLFTCLPRRILDLLRQLAFPLSSLGLDIGGEHNRVDRLALKNTLELYSTSLQNLTVYRGFCFKPFLRFHFQLPHLTQLKLIGYIPKNLYFLKELPMLKTFVLLDEFSSVGVLNMKTDWSATFRAMKFKAKIRSNPFYDYNNLFPRNTIFSFPNFRGRILPNLETLVVGTQFVDGKQMKNLAKLAPNMKTLQLGMGNSGFRIVCKYWSQLEHMHVVPMDVDEDGIFGVSNGERFRLPNIRDLKSLKSISLGPYSEQRRRVNRNMADAQVDATVLLPNLEAALNGRDVEVYREPATVASSSSENDDGD